MRKAEKRRLGRIKFEKDMADSQAHGLRMQDLDRKHREQQLKDTLVQRDVQNLQHVQNKVAKSKKDREEIRKNNEGLARDFVAALYVGGLVDEDAGEMEFGCGIGGLIMAASGFTMNTRAEKWLDEHEGVLKTYYEMIGNGAPYRAAFASDA